MGLRKLLPARTLEACRRYHAGPLEPAERLTLSSYAAALAARYLPAVASVETRLALLERRVTDLHESVNGGGHIKFQDSLRGKVHAMRAELDAARYARQALEEVRRNQGRAWSKRERAAALIIAAIGVTTPYLLFALHVHGG